MSKRVDPSPPSAHRDGKVRKVELLISNLLRAGVSISLLIVVAGTALSFSRHPDYVSSPAELRRLTSHHAKFPRTAGAVWEGVRQFHGRAIVVAGLLLLIATPVLRVAVSILGFVYQKDYLFVAITSVVLALLLLSFILGKGGG